MKNNINNELFSYDFSIFWRSGQVFGNIFSRIVSIGIPTTRTWDPYYFPTEIWHTAIIPYLNYKRDLLAFSCCSKATYALCEGRIEKVNLTQIDLSNEPQKRLDGIKSILTTTGKNYRQVEIIFTESFNDIKLLTGVLDERPDLYQSIIGLDFTSIQIRDSDDVSEITNFLQRFPNLHTLSFGDINKGFGNDQTRWVRLDLSQCKLHNLVRLNFNGIIGGAIIFPQDLDNLEDLSFKANVIGRSRVVDLSPCTFRKLARLLVKNVKIIEKWPFAFTNLQKLVLGGIPENEMVDLSYDMFPNLEDFSFEKI